MNTPKIRFKGYTDAWEQRKLGELASSFEYGLNAAAKEFDGENKYIRITDIDDESHEFKQDDLTSPDTDLSVSDNYRLSDGDILFARTGASVGKTYIYKASDGLVYYAGFLIRARIKAENNPEFVYQNTLTSTYEKFIKVTSMRSGQPGVNAQEYSQFEIMIPSKAEQDKIAYCFRNLDNLITLHQRKCDRLNAVKKYMLQKMFPQNGAKVPEIRFKGFSGDWEQRKLGDMVSFSKGTEYSKSDLQNEGTPIILYGRLYTNYETIISDVDTFVEEKPNSVFSNGREVIVPASGETAEDIAVASVVEKEGVLLGSDLNIITPPADLDSAFLALSISNGKPHNDMAKMAQGKSVVHLHNSDLAKIDLPYPSYEEQCKISSQFTNLDNLITLHQRKCNSLKELKKFMLQNMFP